MRKYLFFAGIIIVFFASNCYSQDITTKNYQTDTAKYALLYVYRPKIMEGLLVNYNIHVADSVVCKVKNNTKFIIKLYKEGPATIWAETEKKKVVNINIQFGHEYFLKCGVSTGLWVSRPEIALIIPDQGHLDWESVAGRKP
jgi:hypothetical protein